MDAELVVSLITMVTLDPFSGISQRVHGACGSTRFTVSRFGRYAVIIGEDLWVISCVGQDLIVAILYWVWGPVNRIIPGVD